MGNKIFVSNVDIRSKISKIFKEYGIEINKNELPSNTFLNKSYNFIERYNVDLASIKFDMNNNIDNSYTINSDAFYSKMYDNITPLTESLNKGNQESIDEFIDKFVELIQQNIKETNNSKQLLFKLYPRLPAVDTPFYVYHSFYLSAKQRIGLLSLTSKRLFKSFFELHMIKGYWKFVLYPQIYNTDCCIVKVKVNKGTKCLISDEFEVLLKLPLKFISETIDNEMRIINYET